MKNYRCKYCKKEISSLNILRRYYDFVFIEEFVSDKDKEERRMNDYKSTVYYLYCANCDFQNRDKQPEEKAPTIYVPVKFGEECSLFDLIEEISDKTKKKKTKK